MSYKIFEKLWLSYFFKNLSAKERVQDINHDQFKLKVNGTYKKGEKLKTKFKPFNDEDVVTKAYIVTNLSKMESHKSFTEKQYNQYRLLSIKQSLEDVLIEKTVETPTEKLCKKASFNNYDKTDEVLGIYLLIEGRRLFLKKIIDVIQCF